jgi:hypothetical protein
VVSEVVSEVGKEHVVSPAYLEAGYCKDNILKWKYRDDKATYHKLLLTGHRTVK